MRKLFAVLLFWSMGAHAAPSAIPVPLNLSIEAFEKWVIDAIQGDPVQFEFSSSKVRFDPFTQILGTPTTSRGDIYFLIGNLEDNWSGEEYKAYFPIARWLSVQGFRAVINPAAYIPDIRDAAQSESTRGIIWSSHGSKAGQIFDKSHTPLPQHIFTYKASKGLKHFVMGDCYGDQVSSYYTFPENSGVHFWSGEITSEDFFKYLTSRKWREDIKADLKFRGKKRPPRD